MASERKTEQAKQLLVRYIRDHQLKTGDRLPPQDFLRKTFNVGTATIGTAINELKHDGVLEVRDKIGVFVIDPNADGHAGRQIGITARHVEESPYYSCMLCTLQMKLIRKGCYVRIFCYQHSRNKNFFQFDIDDYPGLKRSIENKELDGIIHLDSFKDKALKFIHKHEIPLIFVGSEGPSPDGLFYDQKSLLLDICRKLEKFQPRRPALYSSGGIDQYLNPIFMELTGNRGQVYSGRTLEDGKRIADEIIALPEDRRPDWIIYMDDILAQKITSELALHLPADKLPRAVILRNKQLMISYAVPEPIFYDIDMTEVGDIASEMLMDAMKTGNPNPGKMYYRLRESNRTM